MFFRPYRGIDVSQLGERFVQVTHPSHGQVWVKARRASALESSYIGDKVVCSMLGWGDTHVFLEIFSDADRRKILATLDEQPAGAES